MSEVINQLKMGDHAALFYRSRSEQLAVAIPYIQKGLERNERCLYIVDDNSIPVILRWLEEAGVNVKEATERQALRVATKLETYLRHGVFEPQKMVAELQEEVESALAEGFTGLRATGEMSWALDLPSALSRILDYEARLHTRFPAGFLALCQYDETRFPKEIISRMMQLHPLIIRRGRFFAKDGSSTVNTTAERPPLLSS